MLRFRLLGPVHAEVEGHPVRLGPRGQRFVAAVLLLEINTLVPTERLVDLLWPYEPPARARGVPYDPAGDLQMGLSRAHGPPRTARCPQQTDLHTGRWHLHTGA